MKPLPFDMTPLAKALKMPSTGQPQSGSASKPPPKKKPQAASPKPRPSLEQVGVYPAHLSATAGWISTLAREQVHALATHVLARHSEQGLRTLAVTSSVAGEGKTTVTLALSEKLASSGKRVLIIDLDTHRSTLSREAQLEEVDGALESTVSGNGNPPRFHAYATDVKGVEIMPTGRVETRLGDVPLLDPERIHDLVRRGTEEYDIVILDCPPLLPVADTHVIGEVVNSAILVVRAGSTPRDILNQALEEFGRTKFFAAVLNRAQPHNIPYFREVYGYYRRNPAKK
jgi:receptor protein-tyrosine kinase